VHVKQCNAFLNMCYNRVLLERLLYRNTVQIHIYFTTTTTLHQKNTIAKPPAILTLCHCFGLIYH